MLYQLGALAIEVAPFNVHEVSESATTEYATKPVVGIEPPQEYVGEGSHEMTLAGRLFPAEFGGLDELATLHQMRASGRPQYLMRGDGTPLGWWAITQVEAKSTYLDRQGVGKFVEVTITMRRAQSPAAQSYFALLAGVL